MFLLKTSFTISFSSSIFLSGLDSNVSNIFSVKKSFIVLSRFLQKLYIAGQIGSKKFKSHVKLLRYISSCIKTSLNKSSSYDKYFVTETCFIEISFMSLFLLLQNEIFNNIFFTSII